MPRRKKQKRNYLAPALVLGLFLAGALAVSVVVPANEASAQKDDRGVFISESTLLNLVDRMLGVLKAPEQKPSVGAIPGGDIFNPISLQGGLEIEDNNATSTTVTSYTLTADDISNPRNGMLRNSIEMTPNVGALTLTLPATSTLSHVITGTGANSEQCWYNATTTAAATITFAAGTGVDLEVASSSSAAEFDANLTIGAGDYGCFKYIRKADTDIGVLYTPYEDAD